jgi:hypothetical protein
MRTIQEAKKYVERRWRDGDIDYFEIASINHFGGEYMTNGHYIRKVRKSNNYLCLHTKGRSVFINDDRVKDKKISKLHYMSMVKKSSCE